MKRFASLLTISTLVCGMTAFAQTAGDDMKSAGSDVKNATKKTGKATAKGAKKTGHAIKKGTHKAADKVSDKTQ